MTGLNWTLLDLYGHCWLGFCGTKSPAWSSDNPAVQWTPSWSPVGYVGDQEVLGYSDPYVVVSILNHRHQTPVAKRTLNPSYAPNDATFDFSLYLSLADRLGEVALPFDDWFYDRENGRERPLGWDDPENQPFSLKLDSTRANTQAKGSVQVKIGFVAPQSEPEVDFNEVLGELVKRSRPSLVSAPPTEGVGTVRSHQTMDFEDNGGLSFDSDDKEGKDYVTPSSTVPSSPPSESEASSKQPTPWKAVPPALDLTDPAMPTMPTVSSLNKTPVPVPVTAGATPVPTTAKSGFIPRMKFTKRLSSHASSSTSSPTVSTPSTPSTPEVSGLSTPVSSLPMDVATKEVAKRKMKTRRFKKGGKSTGEYSLGAENDIVGIVMLEIQKAEDLPRLKNMTRTGNPSLSFRSARKSSKLASSVTLVTPSGTRNSCYDTDDTGVISHLALTSMLDSLGSTLTRSTISSFFTRHAKNPHTDELTLDKCIQCLETELVRPDSEKKRIDGEGEDGPDTSVSATPVLLASDGQGRGISLDQLDFSGPAHIGVPSDGPGAVDESKLPPPPPYETEPAQNRLRDVGAGVPSKGAELVGTNQVPAAYSSSSEDVEEDSSGSGSGTGSPEVTPSAPASGQVKVKTGRFRRKAKRTNTTDSITITTPSSASTPVSTSTADDPFERVINVKNCPMCHRPRLNSKAEMDIITHLAIRASQDWGQVDKIVAGNFVTASQAQRKWYTKIIGKISSGDYRLGANSANIIVQNSMTGQLEEEKMQVYVRLGIRLLYKGANSRMEGGRARKLLKSLSIKQGLKYDNPVSAADIPGFIEFHNLNVDEILDPLDSFKTFNQFFYRKLKASARPVEQPENPNRLVSAADCRFMAFETVSKATRLWIKGREFSVARLLGDAYKDQVDKYTGGALVIFRLAPQDYHRFHSPVDGKIGPMTFIDGEYYTVNPQAIRTALDVYGENVWKIIPIDSPQFGRVMAVCIGAMMVGSIQTTVNEGDEVKRGQEFGYFAFGGSTIVIIFKRGMVEWDEDLLINGRASLETLVHVGMGIGSRHQSA
ncbi:hypothetical protein ONZ45_g13809 [Pleurotus djamor]|nr:hypothetical protein ONZ45_g13809 [Pleurotus djamor]